MSQQEVFPIHFFVPFVAFEWIEVVEKYVKLLKCVKLSQQKKNNGARRVNQIIGKIPVQLLNSTPRVYFHTASSTILHGKMTSCCHEEWRCDKHNNSIHLQPKSFFQKKKNVGDAAISSIDHCMFDNAVRLSANINFGSHNPQRLATKSVFIRPVLTYWRYVFLTPPLCFHVQKHLPSHLPSPRRSHSRGNGKYVYRWKQSGGGWNTYLQSVSTGLTFYNIAISI